MTRRISILICLLIFILFSSCKKETSHYKLNYNQKANELVQQLILDDSCDCILEIPNESSIEASLSDNPLFDARKQAIKELHLKDRNELDSLEKLSKIFVLDSYFLKQKKINLLKRDSLQKEIKEILLLKKCHKGILSIQKPVFDKDYNKAIIYYGHVFNCNGSIPAVYGYKNGKWTTER